MLTLKSNRTTTPHLDKDKLVKETLDYKYKEHLYEVSENRSHEPPALIARAFEISGLFGVVTNNASPV